MGQTSDTDGQEESSSAEVCRVVKLVLEHAAKRPHESLGVITLGIPHMLRIQASLDRAIRDHQELEVFFSEERQERFFVKNLERVQGDERDVIILSVGYGKDRTGRLLYRFGPLFNQGGERRLNVAIIRARKRMIVVSSFSHLDMDPQRLRSEGMRLLRKYLEYAASGGRIVDSGGTTEVSMNEFEADVYEALTARGMPLIPQYGVSQYRIDFAAKHPRREGQFVLAIECDGANYHSSPTARDRDRLRQQHLEALGWHFHRIWSTDWFFRREEEIQRAEEAYKAAVKAADAGIDGGIASDGTGTINVLVANAGAASIRAVTTHATESREGTLTSFSGRFPSRGPRPDIPCGLPIRKYELADLIDLIKWIQSDGRLRTNEELLVEAMRELGFKHLGPRIREAIERAILAARRT